MELSKILSAVCFTGGILSIALIIAFLFEEVKKINITTVILLLFLGWWSFGCYFWINANDFNHINFWIGLSNFGFTMIPIAFYSWMVSILDKRRRFMIILGFVASFAFALFSFSDLYYTDLMPIAEFNLWPKAGFIYIFYIIFIYLGFYLLGIIEMFNSVIRERDKERRIVNRNILFFSILVFILGISNFPLWYGIKFLPYGGLLAVILNIFLIVYVVLKYEIINTRSFYAQTLIGLILSINIIEIFFSDTAAEMTYKLVTVLFLMLFSSLLIRSYKLDITQKEDLLKLGKKLQHNNRKLKELDNAKNEFISIAAHQLRTPPTVIKGYLNLAKEDPNNKLDAETKDSLSRALASNERLIELVEDILNISRIESGKMQYDFQPNQSMEKIVKDLKETFEIKAKDRGLKLKIDLPKGKLPSITMDTNKIREVLSNLVDNAIKYTAKGYVMIRVSRVGEFVRIEVSDTGMGISKQEIGNLFKKFSRGSNADQLSSGGIGLGIYVGRKIVEAHRGSIRTQSDGLNKGSVFIVELPINMDVE